MLSRFRCSGAMSHLFSLAAGLNRLGARAVAVITHCPPHYLDQIRRYQQFFPCFAESRPEKIIKLARGYRFDLLHLHDLSLAGITEKLLHTLQIPCGATLHGIPARPVNPALLQKLSFLITPHPQAWVPAWPGRRAVFIPEGVDLDMYRPAEKEGFKITFIGEEYGFTPESAAALLKAAGLADVEVELLSPEPLPLLKGRDYGWLLNSAPVLSRSQVVVGTYRGLLEGMACGNAALILGQSYQGMFEPESSPAAFPFPDLSGTGGETPCYRTIFFHLTALLKDRPFLQSLQQQGRKFIRENCDLRLAAERTYQLYRQVAAG